ncbi:MAG: zinc ribbon domain-containing protein [Phycisphaeraceae bacterium]
MPVYEYTCDKCEHTTEALRKMADADEPIKCEQCGSTRTRRAHSVFATATASGASESSLPMSPCGRCGDPGGACPFQG